MIYILHKNAFVPSADMIKNDVMTIFDESQEKVCSFLQVITFRIFFFLIFYLNSTNYILIFVEYN
jgi:hypothetical protein